MPLFNPSTGSSTLVTARYYGSSTTVSGSLATVVWTTTDYQTTGASISSGQVTITTAGKYQVNSSIRINGAYTLNTDITMQIQINGTAITEARELAGGSNSSLDAQISDIINLAVNDVIRIQVSSSATSPTIAATNLNNFLSLAKVG